MNGQKEEIYERMDAGGFQMKKMQDQRASLDLLRVLGREVPVH
jgi:hypothetical protein